jgi:hypothetical protein
MRMSYSDEEKLTLQIQTMFRKDISWRNYCRLNGLEFDNPFDPKIGVAYAAYRAWITPTLVKERLLGGRA